MNICESIYETIVNNIDNVLRKQIVPKFWDHFRLEDETDNGFYEFQLAVYELHNEYEKFQTLLKRLKGIRTICHFKNAANRNRNDVVEFDATLKAAMLSQLPVNFNKIAYSFYNVSFKVFANSHQDNGKIVT